MSQVPFHDFLGIRVESARGGRSRVALALDERMTNKRGVAHGGVTASLLDAALGAALVSFLPASSWCATVSLSVDYVAAARGKRLRAEGRVRGVEGRHASLEGEARDDAGRVVARARARFRVWEHHPDRDREPESP